MGYPIPLHTNPAEFLLELMNIDFASHQEAASGRLQEIQQSWVKSPKAIELSAHVDAAMTREEPLPDTKPSKRNFPIILMTLVHRSFIKSYRDVVAYGIRVAMYTGLAIMMGTVWLRLKQDQSAIQSFTNAIVCNLPSIIIHIADPDSSLAELSCLSWLWHISQVISKIMLPTSKTVQMVSTAQPFSCSQTSSSVSHTSVSLLFRTPQHPL
jgi:hypothetical protein